MLDCFQGQWHIQNKLCKFCEISIKSCCNFYMKYLQIKSFLSVFFIYAVAVYDLARNCVLPERPWRVYSAWHMGKLEEKSSNLPPKKAE